MAKKIIKPTVKTIAPDVRSARNIKRKTSRTVARKPAIKSVSNKAGAAILPDVVIGTVERAQGEALKVYTNIAKQAEMLRTMTLEAAQTVAAKVGVFVRQGQEMQGNAAATAKAQAAFTAKEVKAFAQKSKKVLKQNLARNFDATVTNAKEGITTLEHVFEARVAKTLNTFGVPSAKNVRELQARMADLQKALNQLNKQRVNARS